MSKDFNKIIEGIKSIHLSVEERGRIWHNIDAYVANNPVDETPVIRRAQHGRLSPFFFHTQRVAVFSLVAVLILGGGTSIAAEGALPNDALYNIKVNVNEEVRSWFAFGAESKAYYQTKRAGERLEEAQKLAVMGKLDTEAKDKIQTNLKKHVESVKKEIATIEASNDLNTAIDVSENFENSLKEHSKPLIEMESKRKAEKAEKVDVAKAKVVEDTFKMEDGIEGVGSTESRIGLTSSAPTEGTEDTTVDVSAVATTEIIEDTTVPADTEPLSEIGEIVSTVQENIDVSAHTREEVEAKIPALNDTEAKKEAAEGKRVDAVTQIAKVKENLENDQVIKIPTTTVRLASTTLDKAIDFVTEGDKTFSTQEYGGAFTLFKNGFETAVSAEEILSSTTTNLLSRPVNSKR